MKSTGLTVSKTEAKRGGVRVRPTRPGQHRMDQMVRRSRTRIENLTHQFATGRINGREWYDRFGLILESRHSAAVILGRQRAGDIAAAEADDYKFGRLMAADQLVYLERFRHQILSGDPRYVNEDGTFREQAIQARAAMYADRLRGTANEVFMLASQGMLLRWMLGAVEDHCNDCPELAEEDPKTAEDWGQAPGDGQTACLVQCYCFWLREDGVTGFLRTE